MSPCHLCMAHSYIVARCNLECCNVPRRRRRGMARASHGTAQHRAVAGMPACGRDHSTARATRRPRAQSTRSRTCARTRVGRHAACVGSRACMPRVPTYSLSASARSGAAMPLGLWNHLSQQPAKGTAVGAHDHICHSHHVGREWVGRLRSINPRGAPGTARHARKLRCNRRGCRRR